MSKTPSTTDAARARLQRLEGFIERDPDNVNLLADAAECALSQGDLPRAREHLQRALELAPGNAPLKQQLSSVAIAEGNFDDGLALTAALLDDGVDEAAVRFNHAFALVSLQRHEEALPMLARLHDEQVPYPMVVRLLIRCHHYLGDLDEAIAVADAHLAAHGDDADVAGMLALLHFDNEDFGAARTWGARALGGAPDNLDALLAAGMVALSDEEVDAGKALLQRAVSAQPRNGRAWAGLGLAEMMTFDLPAAERMFGQAVKNMPTHIGSWHTLGWVQLLQGQVDAAEASFRAAFDIDDTFGESHGALAAVAATRGEWDKAERLAEVAKRLDPESMSVRYVDLLKAHRDAPMDPAVTQRFLRQVLQATRAPGGTGTLADMAERLGVRGAMKSSDGQSRS
ncbi:MAG: tetratricopeptide repeat protein [Methyloversatilis sp.]|nr:tetratricopeptide repeat protein [Methyloversatilis sp.]